MNKKRRWRVRGRVASFPDPQQDVCACCTEGLGTRLWGGGGGERDGSGKSSIVLTADARVERVM